MAQKFKGTWGNVGIGISAFLFGWMWAALAVILHLTKVIKLTRFQWVMTALGVPVSWFVGRKLTAKLSEKVV